MIHGRGRRRLTAVGLAALGLVTAACQSSPAAEVTSPDLVQVTSAPAEAPSAGTSLSAAGPAATPSPTGGTPGAGTSRSAARASTPATGTATGTAAGRTTPPAGAGARSGSGARAGAGVVGALGAPGMPLFPASNPWNAPVDTAAADPASATLIASIGASGHLHPDFGADLGEGKPFGIPYVVVPGSQKQVPVSFDDADESDPGPYPIPADAPVEGGPNADGDRHVLVLDKDHRKLYELFDAHPVAGGAWHAGSGAVFDLTSDALRPAGWTSADAAGLAILPGLVRYDEVAAGRIDHALRFTVARTRNGYVAPARHAASSNAATSLPPMGMRVRLTASFDLSGYPAQARVILAALKTYGMIVADNGSNWYISGTPDRRWNDAAVNTLKQVPGSAFEVVRMGPVTTG
jgi:hypothetical protein